MGVGSWVGLGEECHVSETAHLSLKCEGPGLWSQNLVLKSGCVGC